MNGFPAGSNCNTTGPLGVSGKVVGTVVGALVEEAVKKVAYSSILSGERSDQSQATSISRLAGTTRPTRDDTSVASRAVNNPGTWTGGAVDVCATRRHGDHRPNTSRPITM